MSEIVLKLETCVGCPHHMTSPYPTEDSFERPEYYWCKCPDIVTETKANDSTGECRRTNIKEQYKLDKLSFVAGYVEWRDKPEIPNECPIKLDKDPEPVLTGFAADEKLLEDNGWIVECESPFEIRHKDGGAFASGFAAKILLDYVRENPED